MIQVFAFLVEAFVSGVAKAGQNKEQKSVQNLSNVSILHKKFEKLYQLSNKAKMRKNKKDGLSVACASEFLVQCSSIS